MDVLQLLSWACIVFTVGMFSTGLTDLKRMRESKSTENIQFLPFITTCLNNIGWLFYGFLKRNPTIIIVNVIGAFLQILYIIMYFTYTDKRRNVMSQIFSAVMVLTCGWLYFTTLLPDKESQLIQLGLTCSAVTVSMYLSPLTDLVRIVRSGDVRCLSFPLTIATFFTSTSWVLYGQQLNDYYIMVPNTPGIITSLVRFYLFWKFGSGSRSSPSYKSLDL